MTEVTIPRPIRFASLARAEQVCELAKVDHWEYSEVVSGLREQMEEGWRAYYHAGLNDDQAELRALDDFGSVQAVAKIHRGGFEGWCRRLVFSQRYSIHRLVFPVALCLYHGMLSTESSFIPANIGVRSMSAPFVLFGPQYYLSISYILAAIIGRELPRLIRIPAIFAQCAAMGVTLWAFSVLARQWAENVRDTLPAFSVESDPYATVGQLRVFGTIFLTLHLIDVAAMIVALLLAAAQIFDLPSRWRLLVESRRRIYG